MSRRLALAAVLLLLLHMATFIVAQCLSVPAAQVIDWSFAGPVTPPEWANYGRKFRAWTAASDYSLRGAVVCMLLAGAWRLAGLRPSPKAGKAALAHPPRRPEGN